jgi:hypothetical protein
MLRFACPVSENGQKQGFNGLVWEKYGLLSKDSNLTPCRFNTGLLWKEWQKQNFEIVNEHRLAPKPVKSTIQVFRLGVVTWTLRHTFFFAKH